MAIARARWAPSFRTASTWSSAERSSARFVRYDAKYDSINFIWFNARYDDHVYLDRVAIAERFHRQGIGRAMYAEVERLLAERCPNANWLSLEVNLEPRNDQSLGFHDALGFKEVGQQQTDYGAYVSLMVKPING